MRLHFAEIWWGVSEWIGWDNTGRRVFSVSLEDEEVLSDLDIWAEVGPAAPLVRTFYTSVDDGVLDIEFDAKADYATICTIEIDGEQVLSQLENGDLVASWAPGGRAFVDVPVGTDLTHTLYFRNAGAFPKTVGPLYFSGSSDLQPPPFTTDTPLGARIEPGATLPVQVTFHALVPGFVEGWLEFQSTGGGVYSPPGTWSIQLSGFAVPAGAGPGGWLEVSEPVLDVGQLNNCATESREVVFRNSGTAGLMVYSGEYHGYKAGNAFSFDPERWVSHDGRVGVWLEPGEELTGTAFAWQAYHGDGPFEHIYTIKHSGENSPLLLRLRGVGAGSEDYRQVSAHPAFLLFEPVAPGGTATASAGMDYGEWGDPNPFTGISGSGPDSTSFSWDLLDGYSPDGCFNGSLIGSFEPSHLGIHGAIVTLWRSGPQLPLQVPLVGTTSVSPEPVRINCGGPLYIDGLGNTWLADVAYGADTAAGSSGRPIGGTSEQLLYRSERHGRDLSYHIPVPDGVYDVRLHFAELWWGVERYIGQDNEGRRTFDVRVQGEDEVVDIDLWRDVGPAQALVLDFPYVRVRDGVLEIDCEAEHDNAQLCAIEVLPRPEGPIAFTPVRINAGGPAVTVGGKTFQADSHDADDGSFAFRNPLINEIADTDLDAIYLDERASRAIDRIVYEIPAPEPGEYQVTLHFAELYYDAPGYGDPWTTEYYYPYEGSRTFIPLVEGQPLTYWVDLGAHDVATAYVISQPVRVMDGSVSIVLDAPYGTYRATVAAIEVTAVHAP